MSRLLILGATGSLGRHVLRQAVDAGHAVTVFVRTPSNLSPEVRERVSVHTGDLSALVPLDLVRGQDALINCAGHVADGETFVGLVDRLVTGVGILTSRPCPEMRRGPRHDPLKESWVRLDRVRTPRPRRIDSRMAAVCAK